MRYRTRTGKNVSDQSVVSNFTNVTTRAISSSPIASIFVELFRFLIGVYAYISRSFLRIRIGERTFGVLTVLGIFFFAWAIFYFRNIYVQFDIHFSEAPDFGQLGHLTKILAALVSIYVFFLNPFISTLQDAFYGVNIEYPSYSPDLVILSFIVLILSIGHFIEVYSRRRRKEVVHSLYRGDSFFFEWLVGKKIFGIKITKLGVWLILEPLFVYIVALLIEDYLGLDKIAFLLKISAVCLFIEEYRVLKENRQYVLDMLDGQLDGAFSAEIQKEYADKLEQVTEPQKNIRFKAVIN